MKVKFLINNLWLILINSILFINSCDISQDNTLVPNSGCAKYYICIEGALEILTCVF